MTLPLGRVIHARDFPLTQTTFRKDRQGNYNE
jgi:hypothetical protein